MRAVIGLLCLLVFASAGCSKSEKDKQVLVKVNNYEISVEEFNEEFADSPYAMNDTPENRKKFLDGLINRKLILQEAQKLGYDKDARFLKLIERFWEQSLLRVALENKSKEIAGTSAVSEAEIQVAYEKMVRDGATEKPLDDIHKNVKWELQRKKESNLMDVWMQKLQAGSVIRTNEKLLFEKAQGGEHGTSQK